MLKTIVFISVFIVGVITIVLGLTILRIDGTAINWFAIIPGIVLVISGTVGACIYSKKARTFFDWFYEIILMPFFS